MPRKHQRPLFPRPYMGEERMFGLFGIDVAVAFDPMAVEIIGHPVDERDIGIAADRGKADELGHQFDGGKALAHGVLNSHCQS